MKKTFKFLATITLLIVLSMVMLTGCVKDFTDKNGGTNNQQGDKWEYLKFKLEEDKDIRSLCAGYTIYNGKDETDTYEWRMNNGYEYNALSHYSRKSENCSRTKFLPQNYFYFDFYSEGREISGIKFDVTAMQDCILNLEFEIRYETVVNENTGETVWNSEIIKKDIKIKEQGTDSVVVEFNNSSSLLYIELTNVIKVKDAWDPNRLVSYNVDKTWSISNVMLKYA